MPIVAYETNILDDGRTNQNVAAGQLLVLGSELPANAQVKISVSYGAASKSNTVTCDANGNLNFRFVSTNQTVINVMSHLGGGGGWNDQASKWTQPFTVGGKNFLFVIEVI